MANHPDASKIGRILFRLRSLTPIPFILVLIFFSHPAPLPIIIGSLLIVLGEWLRMWAVGYAGGSTRTRTLGAARDLVTTGPYAYVRNPLYLGDRQVTQHGHKRKKKRPQINIVDKRIGATIR